jgi:cell division protein ZapA
MFVDNNFKSISVKLLGKEYKINCPKGQEADLLDAAFYLDQKMTEIRHHGRIYGLERIAIMTALNLAHELLTQNNSQHTDAIEINKRLQQLHDKIDQALEHRDKNPEVILCED